MCASYGSSKVTLLCLALLLLRLRLHLNGDVPSVLLVLQLFFQLGDLLLLCLLFCLKLSFLLSELSNFAVKILDLLIQLRDLLL